MTDVVNPAPTRVLLALLHVHARDGRATVESVGQAAGLRSKHSTWVHLRVLRDAGLVTWEPRRRGTLRPLVREVPGARSAA